MIRSMTGYGRGQAEVAGIALMVEIRAVNHRYGDISVKSPRQLMPLETRIKKQVSSILRRGKVDVFISQESTQQLVAVPEINRPLADAYVKIFRQLNTDYNLVGDVSVDLLAAQKDVVTLQETSTDSDDLEKCLLDALNMALAAVVKMRENEGASTAVDINQRLELLDEKLVEIAARAPQVPIEWQQKLTERLARLGDDAGDPQRVAQEIAIFADRCDISEEVTRYKSHLQQFRELMELDEPVGRQMDFLVQELNREANTMGSKSNDPTLTRQVVLLKSELEKIREQVQNIE